MDILEQKMYNVRNSNNSIDGLKRIQMTQERTSELKDKSIEIIRSEGQREKNTEGKMSKATGTCRTIAEDLTFWHRRTEKGKGERHSWRKRP